MSLSKWAMLVLAFLLVIPWTGAWADPCDDLLIRRAGFMLSRRAQLAATQLVTRETFEQLSSGVTGKMRLVGRSLSSFGTYEALDDWRRLETGKDVFEYDLDSARAAILAGTGEDAFSAQWADCQLEEAKKQPPPSLRGWVQKVEDKTATVRLVHSAPPGAPMSAIEVEPAPFVIDIGALRQSGVPGRLIVERLVTVQRSPRKDILLAAKSGGTNVTVVVPGLDSEVFAAVSPQVQSADSATGVVREAATFVFSVASSESVGRCFEPALSGEIFDLNTIRVTANPVEAGRWEISPPTKNVGKICITARGSAGEICSRELGRVICTPLKTPYTVVLRVDKLRSRTDTGNAAQKLQACATKEEKTFEDPSSTNRGERVDTYNQEAGVPLGSPWAFSFISFCLKQAGLDSQLPVSAYGPQLWANAVKAGLAIPGAEFQKTGELKVGDIYFSGSPNSVGPAGIVIEVSPTDKTFTGIEGNVGQDGRGDRIGVFRKTRKIADIRIGIARFPDARPK